MVAPKSTPKSDLASQYRRYFRGRWQDAAARAKDHAMAYSDRSLRIANLTPAMAIMLSAIVLAGCTTGQANFPSIAIRDAERVNGSLQPAASAPQMPAQMPPGAELVQRLGQLQTTAASAHEVFMNAAAGVSRLVDAAAGGDLTSDRWAIAQVALAGLDSARSQAAVPLGDLDLLHADAEIALEQRRIIEQARDAVTSQIAEEDAILAALRRKMPS